MNAQSAFAPTVAKLRNFGCDAWLFFASQRLDVLQRLRRFPPPASSAHRLRLIE